MDIVDRLRYRDMRYGCFSMVGKCLGKCLGNGWENFFPSRNDLLSLLFVAKLSEKGQK